MIIQGAWLAVTHGGARASDFSKFRKAMAALLRYWDTAPAKDLATGLRVNAKKPRQLLTDLGVARSVAVRIRQPGDEPVPLTLQ